MSEWMEGQGPHVRVVSILVHRPRTVLLRLLRARSRGPEARARVWRRKCRYRCGDGDIPVHNNTLGSAGNKDRVYRGYWDASDVHFVEKDV